MTIMESFLTAISLTHRWLRSGLRGNSILNIFPFFFFLLADPFCLIDKRSGQNLFSLIAMYTENPYNFFNMILTRGPRGQMSELKCQPCYYYLVFSVEQHQFYFLFFNSHRAMRGEVVMISRFDPLLSLDFNFSNLLLTSS